MTTNALSTLQQIAPTGLIEFEEGHPDTAILTAWNKRQELLADIESKERFYDADDTELFDALEDGIPKMPVATPLGLLPKLWIAMGAASGQITSDEMRARDDSIRRADFDEVAAFVTELEWAEHIIFNTISDIRNALRFEQLVPMRLAK